MEVLNVPNNEEEEVALAIEEFLCEKKQVNGVNLHYQEQSRSLSVVFQSKEDEKRLRNELRQIRLDDNVIFEVKWTTPSESKVDKTMPDCVNQGALAESQNQCIFVEVLNVTDEDIVADYFKDILGSCLQYLYNKKRQRMVLFLQSDEEKAKVLRDESPSISDYGSVNVKLIEPPAPGTKFNVEVLNATDEDIIMDYFESLINRRAVYIYFKEAQRMLLTLENRKEFEIILATDVHKIEDLNGEVLVKEFVPPVRGLRVSGIPHAVSEKYLNVYFKNDTHGGGAIKRLNWDSASGTATIFFQQNNVAERVMSRGPHSIRDSPLSMEYIEEDSVTVVTHQKIVAHPKPCNDEKDNANPTSAANGAGDGQVTSCFVVFSDTTNVDDIKSSIKKSWQLHDGEFKLLYNPSECVGTVSITTTSGKQEQMLKNPQVNGMVFEKCDGETKSMLGNVHILVEQISAETSREAVWSWLMVVARLAAHTIYYSDVLPGNSRRAVALVSFREGLGLQTLLGNDFDYQYSIDNRTLNVRVIRSPLKLMYLGVTKKRETSVKQELQQLLDLDGGNAGRIEDVEQVDDHFIVSVSSVKALWKLQLHAPRIGCSCVLPYYDQLGCITSSHVVDYRALVAKIEGDLATCDARSLVRPRLIVTVAGDRPHKETLRKFFADRSVSGGAKNVEIRLNTDGSYFVTFKDDAEAADRVYQKYENERLKLGNCSLSVSIRGMREIPNSSQTQVLVRNIGLASKDSIKFFLWAGSDTSGLTFVRDPHDGTLCAIARFHKNIDRYRLAHYCEVATLDCNHLDIEPLPLSTAVILHNVPSSADKQMVKYCFEPDDVADCVQEEIGTWIVYFKEAINAEKALDGDILYDGKIKLSATRHSEYREDSNAREEGKRGFYLIHCDWASFQIVDFVQKWNQRDFDRLLKETKAVCDFSKDGHLLIRLAGSVTEDYARGVEVKFRSFLSNYDYQQIDVLPDLWKEVLSSKELADIQRLDKSVLRTETLGNNQNMNLCQITLTGHSSTVQNARQKVEQAIRLISDERERQKQRTSHTETLSPWIAKLVVANGVLRRLQDEHKDLDIEIDESRGECRLKGFPSDIKVLVSEIGDIVKSSKEDTFEVSKLVSDFMRQMSVANVIGKKLIEANLATSVLWCVPRACVVQVQSLDAEKAQEAMRIMRTEITEVFVALGEGMHALLNNEKWNDCADAIRGRRNGDVIIVEDSDALQLRVVCWTSDSAPVLEEINNFTRKNLIKKEFMQFPRAVMQLLNSALLPEVKQHEQSQARHFVRLTPKLAPFEKSGFQIEGNIDGIANIKRMLNGLVSKQQKLIVKRHSVSEPGAPNFFKDNISVLQVIGTQTKTYVEVLDPNFMEDSSVVNDCDEVITLPSGVTVEVRKVDITEIECDVIVNPSNKDLHHAGGLAAVIANLAGQDLVKECQEYIRQQGSLPEGQACITNAGGGKLRCKKVVHAVGPRWQGGNRSEVNRLFQAVRNSLYLVEQHGLASVALPPISSGIFGYPLDKCTDTIVESVASYCEEKKGSLSHVLLVDVNDEGTVQFRRALNRYLGKESTLDVKKDIAVEKTKARPQPSSTGITRKSSTVATFTLGDVCVEILNGDITSQQADIIVSTIGEDLDLSAGSLSKLMANGACKDMEQQLIDQYFQAIKIGDIALSDGQPLDCKKVYHVCCPIYDSSQRTAPIQAITSKCLKEANDRQFSTIAFPAIGTGKFQHHVQAVAEQMYNAAVLFCSSVRSPVLRKVKFVLEDSKFYEAFIAYHNNFRAGALFSKQLPPNGTARDAAFIYEETTARAVGNNNPDGQLVGKYNGSSLGNQLKINGVNIEVVLGDITDHDSEAIVNCTNSDFSLNSQVAKALCLKGGSAIGDECRKEASVKCLKRTGVFLQKADGLKCSYIIHVNTDIGLKEAVMKCLKRADDEHMNSVAFPAIGTGSKGKSASDVAPLLARALVEFITNGNCQYVRVIRFVIFDRSVLQAFEEALEAVISPGAQSDLMRCDAATHSGSGSLRNEFSTGLSRPGEVRDLRNADEHSKIMDTALSDVVFSICGTEEHIKEAICLLKKCCESEMKVSIIREEPDIIEELPEEEVEKFLQFGKCHGVTIDVDKRRKSITLRSMDESAQIKARTVIVKSLYDRRTSALNEKISHLDERNTQKQAENVCNRVLWQYKSKESASWSNYPLALTKKMEEGYAQQADIKYGPANYRFTINFANKRDSSDSGLDVDVEIRRQDLDLDLPDYWDSNPDYQEVILDSKSKEYLEVQKEFLSTLRGTPTKVLQITRVQNPHYYRQYVQQKAKVQSGMAPDSKLPVERKLWHGTNEETLKFICHGGFNRSYCGKNATYYGHGVYFARDARYSAQHTYSVPNGAGEKYIMQCLVLTGEYEVGDRNMKFPGKKPHPPHLNFDTTVNDENSPEIFVTYNDAQAYPAYIIKFHLPIA